MKLYFQEDYDINTRITTSTKEPVVWSMTSPGEDYNQCMDILTVRDFEGSDTDYKVERDYIKELVLLLDPNEETAFNLLNTEEKIVAANHKIGTESQRESVLGIVGNRVAMVKYRITTHNVREQRWINADTLLQNELPDDKLAVMAVAKVPLENYTTFGIEGIDSGDQMAGIRDYLDAINGYELNGLRAQSYIPRNMSLNSLCDKLIGVLVYGEY